MAFDLTAVLLASLFGTPPAAEAFERITGGPGYDRGVHVAPLRDGGFAVVGVTKPEDEPDEDVLLVRTDAAGAVVWSKAIGGDDEDNGWAVCETADGLVLAGFTRSVGAGGYDFYLVKTDAAGTVEWSRTYGGAQDDRCWSLAITNDGGFVMAGETRSSGAGERDVLLVRTDASGTELWSRTFGGARDDRCFSVVETAEGNFVLAGQTFSEGAGDRDAHVILTDADGVEQWSRTFGGPESDVAHYVSLTADGMFLVTGYTTSLATEGDDPYIIKLRPDGRPMWTRVVPMPGVVHTITGEEASDGSLYCVGFAQTGQRRGGIVLNLSSTGELMSQRPFPSSPNAESMAYTVRATAGGGCVVTGHATVGGDTDLVINRITPEATRNAGEMRDSYRNRIRVRPRETGNCPCFLGSSR